MNGHTSELGEMVLRGASTGLYRGQSERVTRGSAAPESCREEVRRLRREVACLAFLADFGREVAAALEMETLLCTAARLLHGYFQFDRVEFNLGPELGGTTAQFSALDDWCVVPRLSPERGKVSPSMVKGYRSIGLSEPKTKKGSSRDMKIDLAGAAGTVILYSVAKGVGASFDFLAGIGEMLCAAVKNACDYEKMRELSLKDSLTGLFNRRMLEEMLGLEMVRREREPMALVLIDLDDFKKVNDTFGHPAGDMVLSTFGTLLRSCSRAADIVARYGGEEFAMLLHVPSREVAVMVVERLRKRLAEQSFTFSGCQVKVTASIGVAFRAEGEISVEELRSQADRALYQAKRSGKNRISVYGAGETPVGLDTMPIHAGEIDASYVTIAA